ncbi:MAG: hypothetical protein U1E11_09455 [Dethiobacteria bacterium]|nr:hypothetical protein [Dethiobacteria bacterium]
MEGIIPLLMAKMIDYSIDNGNMTIVLRLGTGLLGLAVLSLALGLILIMKYAYPIFR